MKPHSHRLRVRTGISQGPDGGRCCYGYSPLRDAQMGPQRGKATSRRPSGKHQFWALGILSASATSSIGAVCMWVWGHRSGRGEGCGEEALKEVGEGPPGWKKASPVPPWGLPQTPPPWDPRGFPGIGRREVGGWRGQAARSQGHFLGKGWWVGPVCPGNPATESVPESGVTWSLGGCWDTRWKKGRGQPHLRLPSKSPLCLSKADVCSANHLTPQAKVGGD